jgi:ribosome maturation protein Sdo1
MNEQIYSTKPEDNAEVRYDRHEQILREVIEKGFKPMSTEERERVLEAMEKRVEESERCFKTDRKQLERQFTL